MLSQRLIQLCPRFKSAGVVKNESWVTSEYHFVLDLVLSTLTIRQFIIIIADQLYPLTITDGATADVSICMTI